MRFLENFQFPNEERRSYPYALITSKGLMHVDFAPITIFYGNNGSGKSTVLNIIAETPTSISMDLSGSVLLLQARMAYQMTA